MDEGAVNKFLRGIFMKKRILTFILCITLLICGNIGGLNIFATDTESVITPRFTNTNECTFNFQVLAPGEAHIVVDYNAKSAVFTEAKLTVKIQKRFLLLFWNTVDIGEPNNEWVAYSTDVDGRFYNYFPVDGKGTYRAVFTVEISGTSGVTDVIEETINFTYN